MDITNKELTEILTNNDIVVVDFWAPWCGPCRMTASTYAEFSEKNPDVAIHKLQVDAEENAEAPKKFGIKGIPAFVFFKDGEEVARLGGTLRLNDLQTKLEEVKDA